MAYASDTTVSPERSRAEIETIIKKYGASGFGYMISETGAMIGFQRGQHRIRFMVRLPAPEKFKHRLVRGHKVLATELQIRNAMAQKERQLWRALALCIKAKLEAAESGISDFETEFMPHFVMPDGRTMAESVIPQLETIYAQGTAPLLEFKP